MTSPTRADRLAALAEETPEFSKGARVLSMSDPLATILDEIDATVLPMALRFETEDRALAMLVSGRRLHRITEGAPDDVLDTPLPVDDANLTERAARALEAFANGATDLTVAYAAPPADVDMSDRVSADALAAALGRDADDPDVPPVKRFLSRMRGTITAVIHLNDRVAGEMTGSAADLTGLRIILTSQLSTFVDTRANQCALHADPSLTLLADVIASGTSAGLVIFDAESILFSLPTDALPRAAETFRRLI
ncbi:MAG: hypothetical protein AAFQ58_16455 [Pseudomonadota bacterium]